MATYSNKGEPGVVRDVATGNVVSSTNPKYQVGGYSSLYARQEPVYRTTFDQAGYNKFAEDRTKQFESEVEQEKARRTAQLEAQVRQQQLAYSQKAKLSQALLQGSSQSQGSNLFRKAQATKQDVAIKNIQGNIDSAEKSYQEFVSKAQAKAEKDIEEGKQRFEKKELVGYQTVFTSTDAKPSQFSSAQWLTVQKDQSKYASSFEEPMIQETNVSVKPQTNYLKFPSTIGQSIVPTEVNKNVYSEKVFRQPAKENILEKIQRLDTEYTIGLVKEEEQKIQAGKQGVRGTIPVINTSLGDAVYLNQLRNVVEGGTKLNEFEKGVAISRAEQTKIKEIQENQTVGTLMASDLFIQATSNKTKEFEELNPLRNQINTIQSNLKTSESNLETMTQEISGIEESLKPRVSAYESFLKEKDVDKSTVEIELSPQDYVVASSMLEALTPDLEKLESKQADYVAAYGNYESMFKEQEKLVGGYNTKISSLTDTTKLEEAFSKLTPEQQRTFYTASTYFDPKELAVSPFQRASSESGLLGALIEQTLIGKKAFDKKYFSPLDNSINVNDFVRENESIKYLGDSLKSRQDLLNFEKNLKQFKIKEYVESDRSLENLGTIAEYTVSGAAIGGTIGAITGPAVIIPAGIGAISGAFAGVSDVFAKESFLYSTGDPEAAELAGTITGIGTGLLTAPLEGIAIKNLTSKKILGVGKPQIVNSGLSLDELIGTGTEAGLTKGTGKSVTIFEVPITVSTRKGPQKIFQQVAVLVDDKFFSGTGEAILAGGKKGVGIKIVDVVDDKVIKEAAGLFYEKGTNALSTRLAREGIFIQGEREIKLFKLGQGTESIIGETGLGARAKLLDTPFLNDVIRQEVFVNKPQGFLKGISKKSGELFDRATGRLKVFSEDYFESFATEDVFRQDVLQIGDVTGVASVVKKTDNADELLGVGAYQSFVGSVPEEGSFKSGLSIGSGKTAFFEGGEFIGNQEVRYLGTLSEPAQKLRGAKPKPKTWTTKSLSEMIDETSLFDVGKKPTPIYDKFISSLSSQEKRIYDLQKANAEFARIQRNIMRTERVARTSKVISESQTKTARNLAQQFAADTTISDYTFGTGGISFAPTQPNFGGTITQTLTQTQPLIEQTIETPTLQYTFGETYAITMPKTETLTIPKRGTKTITDTKIIYDYPTRLKESTMLQESTLLKSLTGLGTSLKQETLLKTLTKTDTDTILKTQESEISGTILKEQDLLKSILKEDMLTKSILKETVVTKTSIIPFTPTIPITVTTGIPSIPKTGYGDFKKGYGWKMPMFGTRTRRTKPLFQIKSDLFRKFVTGEKDIIASKENVNLVKNIWASKGSFLGFIPTKELLAKKRKRRKKK